ncbi:unnamed protein product [Prunus armeniaca]|uniref:Uncharacterized protein n=1 Tax=Prunus armeniaca TaxID=36596 RepID=A0A6J5XXL5_PRUAR|nr:unnamed protein product [Prunus armeniaca]
MVVLHVDNKVIAGEAIDLGEGWGEGDEVVMAVVVWLEKVVDLMGEKVAVRFRVLTSDALGGVGLGGGCGLMVKLGGEREFNLNSLFIF